MPLPSGDLEPVRGALRRMAWELNLEQPAEPVPLDDEGVDSGRDGEAPSETGIETLHEIDDLTNLLADHAISTLLLEANLGADLNAAVSGELITSARITFESGEGEEASFEPLTDDEATDKLYVTTSLLSNLATLRAECGVDQLPDGRKSKFRPPRFSRDALLRIIDYLRAQSTLGDVGLMESWVVNEDGWEVWR